MELLERTSFMHTLAEYAGEARLGGGRLVLVSGESGIGKTALVETFQQHTKGARWLWGSCDALLTPRPLGPLFDIGAQVGGELDALCRQGAAWAQPRVFDPGPGVAGAAAAGGTAPAPMTDMPAGPALIRQLAQARLATAKYATNLARAKADGYQVITPMMPDMGIHYMNPGIGGFTITKPQILVYEHHGNTWQLGALEWVFPSMPKTPPLPNATFGFFPAACHYKDGTFIPDKNSKTCAKTSPKTGSKFSFWHPDLTTMHVWIWYPNPAGLYSSTNPLVAPFNGG